jgi:arsenate reductase
VDERRLSGPGRPVLAEFLGTLLLVAAVVGSGIAAARLSPGNIGLQLLESSAATGAALVAIIYALGPVSGAHLNPLVTLADWVCGGVRARTVPLYLGAQLAGAGAGAIVANLMFGLPALQIATRPRSSVGLWLGEVVATFGLLLVIFGVVRARRSAVAPIVVGTYIAAAYWFTSSTSFANPAVTLARTLSDTFAGIAPGSVLPFVGAQIIGAILATVTVRFLYPDVDQVAEQVVVPDHLEVTS